MYCEGCLVDMAEKSEKIRCQECNVCDPRGFPKVCLILEQLLEENFPEEYNSRRSGIQKTLAHNSKGSKYLHPCLVPICRYPDMLCPCDPKV